MREPAVPEALHQLGFAGVAIGTNASTPRRISASHVIKLTQR